MVYVNPALSYAFTITSADGATTYDTLYVPAEITLDTSFTADNATSTATLTQRFGDVPNAIRDFGCKADGSTDDTSGFQAFVNACQTYKKRGIAPGTGSYYKITAPIVLSGTGGDFEGSGLEAAWLKASGNFDAVFQASATAAGKHLRDIWIETTGTTTKCMNFQTSSSAFWLQRMRFLGNLSGDLVYSNASGYLDFDACKFDCNNAATIGLALDMYNQGTRIRGRTLFGGVGIGSQIRKSSTGDRVEGTVYENVQFLNTGSYALAIGNSFLTQVIGCNIDQQSTYCITADDSADLIQIVGTWLGLAAASTGVCLNFAATAGDGHVVEASHFYGGNTGIGFSASGANRVEKIGIIGNTFNNHANNALSMDSVLGARIVGNADIGTPANGSWITAATFGAGRYHFDNNWWATTAPSLFHSGSTYKFGHDRGISGREEGSASGTTDGSGDLTVTHSCFTTPNRVYATTRGTTFATAQVHTIGATTFKIRFLDAAGSALASTALAADWIAVV